MLSKLKFAFISMMAAGLIFCLSNVSSAYDRGGEWPPEASASILVQVIALGSPIEHADVSVGDNSDSTGHNGNSSFTVAPGTYTVSGTGPDGGSATAEIRVRAGEIAQVTLELGSEGLHAGGGH